MATLIDTAPDIDALAVKHGMRRGELFDMLVASRGDNNEAVERLATAFARLAEEFVELKWRMDGLQK